MHLRMYLFKNTQIINHLVYSIYQSADLAMFELGQVCVTITCLLLLKIQNGVNTKLGVVIVYTYIINS